MWKCGNCRYVWDGEEPPDQCPKCGAKKEKFVQLEDKAVELVDRARFTNSLHMHLYALLEQVMEVADAGIEDNLDAPCVRIFTKAADQAEILQQSVKAELEGHMQKGKWG
jgi:predicted  nucleic acid-binding Zn-ribbon protein